MILVVSEGVDALPKSEQRRVDVTSFFETVSCVLGSGVALGTS